MRLLGLHRILYGIEKISLAEQLNNNKEGNFLNQLNKVLAAGPANKILAPGTEPLQPNGPQLRQSRGKKVTQIDFTPGEKVAHNALDVLRAKITPPQNGPVTPVSLPRQRVAIKTADCDISYHERANEKMVTDVVTVRTGVPRADAIVNALKTLRYYIFIPRRLELVPGTFVQLEKAPAFVASHGNLSCKHLNVYKPAELKSAHANITYCEGGPAKCSITRTIINGKWTIDINLCAMHSTGVKKVLRADARVKDTTDPAILFKETVRQRLGQQTVFTDDFVIPETTEQAEAFAEMIAEHGLYPETVEDEELGQCMVKVTVSNTAIVTENVPTNEKVRTTERGFSGARFGAFDVISSNSKWIGREATNTYMEQLSAIVTQYYTTDTPYSACESAISDIVERVKKEALSKRKQMRDERKKAKIERKQAQKVQAQPAVVQPPQQPAVVQPPAAVQPPVPSTTATQVQPEIVPPGHLAIEEAFLDQLLQMLTELREENRLLKEENIRLKQEGPKTTTIDKLKELVNKKAYGKPGKPGKGGKRKPEVIDNFVTDNCFFVALKDTGIDEYSVERIRAFALVNKLISEDDTGVSPTVAMFLLKMHNKRTAVVIRKSDSTLVPAFKNAKDFKYVLAFEEDEFDNAHWSGTKNMDLLPHWGTADYINDGEGNPIMLDIDTTFKPRNRTQTADNKDKTWNEREDSDIEYTDDESQESFDLDDVKQKERIKRKRCTDASKVKKLGYVIRAQNGKTFTVLKRGIVVRTCKSMEDALDAIELDTSPKGYGTRQKEEAKAGTAMYKFGTIAHRNAYSEYEIGGVVTASAAQQMNSVQYTAAYTDAGNTDLNAYPIGTAFFPRMYAGTATGFDSGVRLRIQRGEQYLKALRKLAETPAYANFSDINPTTAQGQVAHTHRSTAYGPLGTQAMLTKVLQWQNYDSTLKAADMRPYFMRAIQYGCAMTFEANPSNPFFCGLLGGVYRPRQIAGIPALASRGSNARYYPGSAGTYYLQNQWSTGMTIIIVNADEFANNPGEFCNDNGYQPDQIRTILIGDDQFQGMNPFTAQDFAVMVAGLCSKTGVTSAFNADVVNNRGTGRFAGSDVLSIDVLDMYDLQPRGWNVLVCLTTQTYAPGATTFVETGAQVTGMPPNTRLDLSSIAAGYYAAYDVGDYVDTWYRVNEISYVLAVLTRQASQIGAEQDLHEAMMWACRVGSIGTIGPATNVDYAGFNDAASNIQMPIIGDINAGANSASVLGNGHVYREVYDGFNYGTMSSTETWIYNTESGLESYCLNGVFKYATDQEAMSGFKAEDFHADRFHLPEVQNIAWGLTESRYCVSAWIYRQGNAGRAPRTAADAYRVNINVGNRVINHVAEVLGILLNSRPYHLGIGWTKYLDDLGVISDNHTDYTTFIHAIRMPYYTAKFVTVPKPYSVTYATALDTIRWPVYKSTEEWQAWPLVDNVGATVPTLWSKTPAHLSNFSEWEKLAQMLMMYSLQGTVSVKAASGANVLTPVTVWALGNYTLGTIAATLNTSFYALAFNLPDSRFIHWTTVGKDARQYKLVGSPWAGWAPRTTDYTGSDWENIVGLQLTQDNADYLFGSPETILDDINKQNSDDPAGGGKSEGQNEEKTE